MKFNCSGNVLSLSEFCVKISGLSNNSSFVLNCLNLAGSEHQGSMNITSNSSLANLASNSSSPVVVQLLVSPSKVLSVSLETSSKLLSTASSVILQVLPNKTVAVLQTGTRSENTSTLSSTVKDHEPTSTVHVNLPVSSKVEVKVVPTTEKVVPTTEKIVPTTEKVVPTTEKVVPTTEKVVPTTEKVVPTTEKVEQTTHEPTTANADKTQPSTANKPSTQQKTDTTQPMTTTHTGGTEETTVKTTIHIIKNTVKSPYAEEEQSMRFFMSNVMMPISCGVGAAIIIALAFFLYRRCRRRKLKRVRYFGNKPGEKQFLDRMKLLEDSSEEE